jgi:hypothetical protein
MDRLTRPYALSSGVVLAPVGAIWGLVSAHPAHLIGETPSVEEVLMTSCHGLVVDAVGVRETALDIVEEVGLSW